MIELTPRKNVLKKFFSTGSSREEREASKPKPRIHRRRRVPIQTKTKTNDKQPTQTANKLTTAINTTNKQQTKQSTLQPLGNHSHGIGGVLDV